MLSSKMKIILTTVLVLILAMTLFANGKNPKVLIETNMGNIEVELFQDKAPVSVKNFLSYVNSGFYTNVIFHRVMAGFMIQAGGFDKSGSRKQTQPPIVNEADNGLKNRRGTLAYARTNVINSATSQFFINLEDNTFLDHTGKNSSREFGYCVFGKVTKGMKVVDKIAKVKTKAQTPGGEVSIPVEMIVILSAKVIAEEKK